MKPGLLKRLNGDAIAQCDGATLAGLIAGQLADLLNVRVGSCAARADLGLPAVSPIQLQGDALQAERLAQVIQLQVNHFEPRLQQAQVTAAGQAHGILGFRLQAVLVQGYERWQCSFRIEIDNDSRVAVQCRDLQQISAERT